MYRENFPKLTDDNFEVTSPYTWDYNCIAWTFGESRTWWSPAPGGYYWPRGLPKNARDASNLVQLYVMHGFEVCEDGSTALAVGFEKVALYTALGGEWRHAALQRPDGKWTSKLAEHEDIVHDMAEDLLGGEYLAIAFVLRRQLQKLPPV